MSRIRSQKLGSDLSVVFTQQDNVEGKITFNGTNFVPTHPFSLTGDGTQQIEITSGFSGTDMISLEGTGSNSGILISGACGKGIEITGSCTTGIGILTGTYTTGISIAGTTTTGLAIASCTTGLSFTGTQTTHISSATALVTSMPATAPGTGFDTAGGIRYATHGKLGGLYLTEIYVDLKTAAVSSQNTDLDIIGEAAGNPAYIGRITAANMGTVVAIQMVCLEAPATGSTDIDLYSSTAATGAYDTGIATLAGYAAVITSGAAWTNGRVLGATAIPAANTYLYLTSGTTTAGAYSAGKFLIRIYGA